jgi:transcriptional regulator with XRE-family HTH domain
MKKHTAHPISEAVRELRTALGETQQQFAHRMKTAIRTIARWETIQPPQGETLNQMAILARRSGLSALAGKFERAYTAYRVEAPDSVNRSRSRFVASSDGTDFGAVRLWMEGSETTYGEAFVLALGGLRGKDPAIAEKCRRILQTLKESVDAISENVK